MPHHQPILTTQKSPPKQRFINPKPLILSCTRNPPKKKKKKKITWRQAHLLCSHPQQPSPPPQFPTKTQTPSPSTASVHSASVAPPLSTTSGRRSSSSAVVRAELSPSVVISLSTGLSLFLGRFVFFNFQRENVAKQVPEQNGKTHFEAGDDRAKEYVSLLKSNDPVGFNIVDVLAWGSIGHIVAYLPLGHF